MKCETFAPPEPSASSHLFHGRDEADLAGGRRCWTRVNEAGHVLRRSVKPGAGGGRSMFVITWSASDHLLEAAAAESRRLLGVAPGGDA